MDLRIVFALLLCLVKYNDGFCRDRCLPYPIPFEVGCPTSTCSPTSSCSCPTSSCSCPTSICSPASTCSSWFRDVHEPCNTVDVVYFPEVQYPCGMEWDKPYYYGTCWCT